MKKIMILVGLVLLINSSSSFAWTWYKPWTWFDETGGVEEYEKFVEWRGTKYWGRGGDSAVIGRFGRKVTGSGPRFFEYKAWTDIPDEAINKIGPFTIEVEETTARKFGITGDLDKYVELKAGGDIKYTGENNDKVTMRIIGLEVDPEILLKQLNKSPFINSQLNLLLDRDELPRVVTKNIVILDLESYNKIKNNAGVSLAVKAPKVGNATLSLVNETNKATILKIDSPVVRAYTMGHLVLRCDGDKVIIVSINTDVPGESDKNDDVDCRTKT